VVVKRFLYRPSRRSHRLRQQAAEHGSGRANHPIARRSGKPGLANVESRAQRFPRVFNNSLTHFLNNPNS
jgi:hypothetical protein